MKINRKTDISKTHAMHILSERLAKRAFYACLLLVCCTACSDEDNAQTVATAPLCPLAIGMVHLDSKEVSGRATLGEGEVIGVFATNASGVSSYTNRYNVGYEFIGGKWRRGVPILLGKDNASVSAYHPYKSGEMTGSVLKLTSQVYQSTEDISFATAQDLNSTSTQSATIDFLMKRAYSQIEFTLKRADTYDANFKVTRIGIKHSGIIGSCDLDVADGTYSSRVVNDNFSYVPGSEGIGGNKETILTSSVLMVPPESEPAGQFTISLTLDGLVSTVNIQPLALTAGKRYKVTITIEGIQKITVDQVTVEDWVEVTIPEYPV